MDEVVACSLGAAERTSRRERWGQLNARAGFGIGPTHHGLRLSFRPDAGVEEELNQFVVLERECCAFAEWEVCTDSARIVLEVTAKGQEAVAAVQAMFGDLRASRATS